MGERGGGDAEAPMNKKSKNLVLPPLTLKHFEIWVQKPPMAERVKTRSVNRALWSRMVPGPLTFFNGVSSNVHIKAP